jgi:hypothetical protein
LESKEVLDVVEDAFAFFDGVENRGEIVICQNHVCSFFGDIGSLKTH